MKLRKILTIGAVSLALLVAAVFLVGGLAQADHDPQFTFTTAVDEDGDRHAENPTVSLKYLRSLLGVDQGDGMPTLDANAGWTSGDRKGYECAYAFLKYRGTIQGRVTVFKTKAPDGSNYVEIHDKFMEEGVRNYDGTINTYEVPAGGGENQPAPGRSCPGSATEPYEPLSGPGQFPSVTFQHGEHTIEVRDFADSNDVTIRDTGTAFKTLEASPTKVSIAQYLDGLPVMVVYYELMPDLEKGLEVGEDVPGTTDPVTLHVGCGTQCVPHEPEPTPSPSPSPVPPPSPNPSPTPEPCPVADLNGDCRVDIADLRILVENWTD